MKISNARWLLHISLALITMTAAVMHFQFDGSSAAATGFPLIFDHIFQLVTAIALLWIAAGVGHATLNRLGMLHSRPVVRLTYATAIGYSLLAIALLLLGSLGLLSPLPVSILMLLAIILSHRSLLHIPEDVGHVIRWIINLAGDGACRTLFLAVVLLTLVFLALSGLSPATDWDSLMYHLQIPRQFVQQNRIYVPADNLHVSYIGLIHMLYIPALLLQANAAPALINAMLSIMLALAVVEVSQEFFDERTAWLSLPFFWANTILLLIASTARIDVSLALLLFLSHLATMQAIRKPDRGSWFLLGGFLLGSSIGVKLSALAYAFGLAPLLVIHLIKHIRNREAWLQSASWLLALIVGAIPWIAKNYALLGAPLYPFFANRIVDPWMIPILGTRIVPESSAALFKNLTMARSKLNPIAALVSPSIISIEAEGVYYFLNPIFITIPLLFFHLRDHKRLMLLIPPALYISGMYIFAPASNLRYYIPMLPALTILLANLLVKVTPRTSEISTCSKLLLPLAVLSLIPTTAMIFWQLRTTPIAAYLSGTINRNDYLSEYPESGFPEYMQAVEYVQDSLPSDSVILMLFEARGYYITRETLQDNVTTNWPLIVTRISTGQDLQAVGISHIVVNEGALRYYNQRGVEEERFKWDTFQRFSETELNLIFENAFFSIYEIDAARQ